VSSTRHRAQGAGRTRIHGFLATVGCALALGGLASAAEAHGWSGHRGGADRWRGDRGGAQLVPGNLLLNTSVYSPADIEPGVTELPPGGTGSACAPAIADGAYPGVFNNDTVDGSFGVTSRAFLEELTPRGQVVDRVPVPARDLVTSFSSKSELALDLSTDGQDVTFMGYQAPVAALDVSNSNTPGVIDPTNPVTGAYYRVVAELDRHGHFHFTLTNAYSGNNGRAAVLNSAANVLYAAGNAGNGSGTQPAGVILGAGAQILTPSSLPETFQNPGTPTPVGSFNVTQLGDKADKVGKDTNFRGLTVFDNVVYYTKGSGGNGVNTVYFIDTTGQACPNGVGLPEPGAQLPTSPIAYDPAVLQTEGVVPYNMCILKGFPTTLAKSTTSFPFGIWFANADTIYVADEGSGDNTYSTATGQYTNATATAQPRAGLEKWVFNAASGSWQLAYTLQSGLNLGQPYAVPGYPTGVNPVTKLPWAPATDGLRNITGRVNRNGTATVWAITSTVSGSGDQGADPNKLVEVTDSLAATTPGTETFGIVRSARSRRVLRGISFTPGTLTGRGDG
jgi:hypothetical protein